MEKAKDGSAENSLGWARVERRARIDSEMTRFVDQMALTDKKFSLFWTRFLYMVELLLVTA